MKIHEPTANPRFVFENTPIEGVKIAKRLPAKDCRGFFERFFCESEYKQVLNGRKITQINHSRTIGLGTTRGMHYQRGSHSEMKIISCLQGAVYDVAVDLRRDSPTFLSWYGLELTAENFKTLIVPEGCAHGFQSLGDSCELIYLCTSPYESGAEGIINALDPGIGIDWPQRVMNRSQKDASAPFIAEGFLGL